MHAQRGHRDVHGVPAGVCYANCCLSFHHVVLLAWLCAVAQVEKETLWTRIQERLLREPGRAKYHEVHVFAPCVCCVWRVWRDVCAVTTTAGRAFVDGEDTAVL